MPAAKWIKCNSSNLGRVKHDVLVLDRGHTGMRLHVLTVEFKNGGVYQYYGVPVKQIEAMMKAESQGKYFIANIREQYDYRKVK